MNMTHRVTPVNKKKRNHKKKGKPFSVRDRVAYKATLAAELAERLMESPALLVDEQTGEVRDHPARYFAGLLLAESSGANHVTATFAQPQEDPLPGSDQVEGPEVTYQQGIPLARHSLRIGPAYSQALRRRAHRVAEVAIQRAKDGLETMFRTNPVTHKRISESWAFKTKKSWSYRWVHGIGTMQHPPGAEAFPEVERINRVWELFRKRKIYTDNVAATVKGVEGRVTPRGAHVHQHNLFLMKKVDLGEWERNWQECGGGFFRLYTVVATVTDDQVEQTQDQALDELCKYITKTEDLLDPDPETGERVSWQTLLNLCTPARWPRMFEILGLARAPALSRDLETQALEEDEFFPGRSPGFRSIHREYLTATPPLEQSAEEWEELHDGPDPTKWTYFDRQAVPHPPRPPTWRQLMAILPLDKWLEIIASRMERAQNWRLGQIIARALGPVIDLDGNTRTVRRPE